jgi:hypothetical protein
MAASPFYLDPAGDDVGANLSNLGLVLRANREKREQEEAVALEAEQMRAAQAEMLDAYNSGDPAKVAEVSIKYPKFAENAYKTIGLMEDFQKKEATDFATQVLGNPAEAAAIAERRLQLLNMQGRDTTQTMDFYNRVLSGDTEGALKELELGLAYSNPDAFKAFNEARGTVGNEPEAMQTLRLRAQAANLVEGTPEYAAFMANGGNPSRGQASAVTRTYDNGTVQQVLPDGSIKVFDPAGNEVTGQQRVDVLRAAREEQVDFKAAAAAATGEARASTARIQSTIDEGLDAAMGAATLRRGIDLLQEIQTGGIAGAKLKAKQLFGVESADEGELSSTLGKAVLQQLKSTFGAQFTEREGDRLEGFSARMGSSTEANLRLLQQAYALVERSANRAIDAAYEIGDDRTARDIEDLLDFTLTDTGGDPGATETPGAAAPSIAGNQGATTVGRFLVQPLE